MSSPIAFAVAMCTASAAFAGTMTTDFSGFSNGHYVEGTTFNSGSPAEFVATSSGDNQGLRIFDSTPGGPNDGGVDDDLVLPGHGNVLILQDNTGPTPNDASEGGSIYFNFTSATQLVSVDLIDIDRHARTYITLTDTDGDQRIFTVPDHWTGEHGHYGAPGYGTLDFATNFQVGFWGVTASFFDIGSFDLMNVIQMKIKFKGSAALDNLVAMVPDAPPLVPLPAPGLLGLAGLGAFTGVRRRAC